ncbi:uncharacterized protein PADG_06406 [Paracoccidioides brasiliensis Pb18]|uniref:Uncharacterized protein n=1 Tax=Paracoccidioides brasiliensis (strain Pb18) TaxID=502780 RepID=C1GGG9_PARBD|nr:uncharacterized protein PADG_06406 [Paracoccidioides brasiliensis Pb18]EEH50327.2 hypothetical protein PADG_06406 [Paracoccidioides brasiliensis Pb18]
MEGYVKLLALAVKLLRVMFDQDEYWKTHTLHSYPGSRGPHAPPTNLRVRKRAQEVITNLRILPGTNAPKSQSTPKSHVERDMLWKKTHTPSRTQ